MSLSTRRSRLRLLLASAAFVLTAGLVASPAHAAPAGAAAAPGPAGTVGTDIVGGGFVYDAKPWIAALHSGGSFTCTSTQISAWWIITAAHCVPNNSGYAVRIGSLLRSSGGTWVGVDRVVRHPGFDWPTHDIALLHLASPHWNVYAELADAAGDVQPGQNATIYGWGSEHPDWSGPLPERLKYADGYLATDVCHSDAAPLLCTQTDGSVAGGDSGGPLFVDSPSDNRYVQAGVCALGYIPAGNGQAGYTSIPMHRDWIRGHTGV